MPEPINLSNFWVIFLINLPVVSIVLIALGRKWLVMGSTHKDALREKDEDIRFREQLRQEALADKKLVEQQTIEDRATIQELTTVVSKSVAITEALVADRGTDDRIQREAAEWRKPAAKPRRPRSRT